MHLRSQNLVASGLATVILRGTTFPDESKVTAYSACYVTTLPSNVLYKAPRLVCVRATAVHDGANISIQLSRGHRLTKASLKACQSHASTNQDPCTPLLKLPVKAFRSHMWEWITPLK